MAAKSLWLGIHLFLLPGQCPSLAWGHTEIPEVLGSVPCLSLGRRGGRSADGRKVLRHKALIKNLNISSIMGRHLHFTAFGWARSL